MYSQKQWIVGYVMYVQSETMDCRIRDVCTVRKNALEVNTDPNLQQFILQWVFRVRFAYTVLQT
jgi:hypothetical protein